MKISMMLFAEFVNRTQQRASHSSAEVFGSQNCSRIGRKLPREWKLMREVAAILKQSSHASHIKTWLSCAATTEGRYARKREEQSCNEISCTLHSLSYPSHIAHSTNFTQLVDLVVSCGARELQVFVENASRNAVDTSWGAVVDYRSTWNMVEESIIKRHQFF